MKPPVVANISFFPNPRLEKEDLRGTYGECGHVRALRWSEAWGKLRLSSRAAGEETAFGSGLFVALPLAECVVFAGLLVGGVDKGLALFLGQQCCLRSLVSL
jgi:hypothetical protein